MSLGLGYIGPFRLLEIVNRGQSCCLWRAYDDVKREFVGIKTLLEAKAKERGQVQLLEHEYKVASKFSHPNLIKIFHYAWHNKSPYIGMEWFSAINLKMWINRGYESYCEHLRLAINAVPPTAFNVVENAAASGVQNIREGAQNFKEKTSKKVETVKGLLKGK